MKKYLKYIGYAGFFFVCFLAFLYWGFPWDLATERVLQLVRAETRTDVRAKSVRPNWVTGLDVDRLEIPQEGADPIILEEVHARALLLPMLTGKQGVEVSLPIARGQVDATVIKGSEGSEIKGEAKKIELALLPALAAKTGVPLSGKLDLAVDLMVALKPKDSQGVVRIKAQELSVVKGGERGLPALNIGDFDWSIPIEDGKAILKDLKIRGPDAEVDLSGDIKIGSPLTRSILNLAVSFKPTEALFKREPILKALLANIKKAKGKDGFYSYSITGSVKHPRTFKRPRR